MGRLQPDFSVTVLNDEPTWLDEIAHAVVTALARESGRGDLERRVRMKCSRGWVDQTLSAFAVVCAQMRGGWCHQRRLQAAIAATT